ncbi:aminoglycoside phosphotransferase family protein [Streptomyces europaeiscabiei]|uniref:phosphotransferase n=2 Tax=Streptomyces europaeiscabiei TaxID=146819 RepID=UPI0029A6E1D0|nr:phosphotransferase [Streptomyces europaeiscabiei]MDX3668222.1 phosphotransferase [Streptomyces europaeiscabiei]MDX3708923.1 phosphotransferase [Streptomyces europaeiscabiei]MDX3864496.1 phosphotransferase [Streptomyces europaeiscabiei]MDX3871422.1 phosphotransferase [Streptomyces europaeiscabiei]
MTATRDGVVGEFAEPPVEQFATGFQRTSVHRVDNGYVLVRRPGSHRPTPLKLPPSEALAALRALRTAEVRLVLPEAVDDSLHYLVPGTGVAAKLSVPGACNIPNAHVASALHGTGVALRRLHAEIPVSAGRAGPPGPARLAAWLRSDRPPAGPGAAGALHSVTLRQLGSERWSRVLAWCEELAVGHARDVFLHGAPSLGSIVVGPQFPHGWLMIGEDLARGPADHDLGWLLGEFVEWRMTLRRPLPAQVPPMDPEAYEAARAALLQGYGTLSDPVAAGRAAVLRVFTHAHDFAAYMGWHDELFEYTAKIAELIDDEGACAISAP